MKHCAAPGCDRDARGRTYCNTHRMRLRQTGTLEPGPMVGVKQRNSKFFEYLASLGDSEGPCVEWPGFRNKKHYGVYRRHGENLLTRSLWVEMHGELQSWMLVCHTCDNPPCARPSHLFLGTHAVNSADAVSKGRTAHPRNELSGRARLTDGQVARIRELRAAGTKLGVIAAEFGVHSAHVSRIVNGRRRPHANPEQARQDGWLIFRRDMDGAA